jgi:hypothetical protein
VIFIGSVLAGDEAELEVPGVDAVGVLAVGGVEGPLAHAAVDTVNDTAAVNATRLAFISTP